MVGVHPSPSQVAGTEVVVPGYPLDVRLTNEAVMVVEVVAGTSDVKGVADGLPSFEDVKTVITGIGTDIIDAVKAIAPTKATVEFGLTLTVKEGTLTGMLVKGGGEAQLTVTLEWERAAN